VLVALVRPDYLWHNIVMKSISVAQKKRGRPATGQIPHVTARIPQEVLDALDSYVKQGKAASRTEAIRQILTDNLKKRGFLK
jgi:hypothetical protein